MIRASAHGTLAGVSERDVLTLTSDGLYCPAGGFHIDPWQPVARAVVTHAHADHLRWGCRAYLVSAEAEHVTRARVGNSGGVIETAPYGQPVTINDVRVSFHPAGHILGSAQIRVEHRGQVWVVSGDYKTEHDATCAPFELVKCHVFITESTFGLPIYHWQPQREVFEQINAWWRDNAAQGRASVIHGYALGKAQRILAGVDASIGPIITHGAVESMNRAYRLTNNQLPTTQYAGDIADKKLFRTALVVAPPSSNGTSWVRRFGDFTTAFASGWMQIRGARRRRAVDRGFVLSDHVDWPSLNQVVRDTGAQRVWVTHGYSADVARWLNEQGIAAQAVETRYEGERDDVAVGEEDEEVRRET
jgi:putative mRNA 3-end processing factor